MASVCIGASVGHSAPWRLEVTDGDFKIYKRSKPGSDIKEVKAVGTINAPAHAIVNVIDDVEHYKDFMPFVGTSTVLSRKGRTVVSYQLMDAPFISDRDCTVVRNDKSEWKSNGTPRYRLDYSIAQPEVGPKPKPGVVRLKVVDGSWDIEPLDKKRTRATYYLYTDPGGALPAFIVNLANEKGLGGLFDVIEEQANKAKYADRLPAYPEASKKPASGAREKPTAPQAR